MSGEEELFEDESGLHLGTVGVFLGEKGVLLGDIGVHMGEARSFSGVMGGSAVESNEDLLISDTILAEGQTDVVAEVVWSFLAMLVVTGVPLRLPGWGSDFGTSGSFLVVSEKVLMNVFLVKAGKVLLLLDSLVEMVVEVVSEIVQVVVVVVAVVDDNREGTVELLVVNSLVEHVLGESTTLCLLSVTPL